MTPVGQQIAYRLIAHRQAALGHTGGWARSWRRAWTDELAVWTAALQTRPDELTAVLHLLTTEVAQHRRDTGQPILDAPAPVLPPDPAVEIDAPSGQTLLARLAATLHGFPDWRIEVTLDTGETVTARPARTA